MEENKKSICWIGLHSYQIHKEIALTNISNSNVGLVIINRCTNCGKISHSKIRTVEPSYN